MNELKRQRDLAESQLEQERSTHKEQKVLYYCIHVYICFQLYLLFFTPQRSVFWAECSINATFLFAIKCLTSFIISLLSSFLHLPCSFRVQQNMVLLVKWPSVFLIPPTTIQLLISILQKPLVFTFTKKCFLGRMQHKCYFSVCN